MKAALVLVALFAAVPAIASKSNGSPLDMVFQLMDELTAKITREGEEEAAAYKEYFDWCDDTATEKGQEVETYSKTKSKLEAKIIELTEAAEEATVKIEDLTDRIAENTKDLDAATKIFEKEKADFEGSEKELIDSVDTMGRAVGILEKEMAKAPGSFAQIDTSSLNGLLSALSIVDDAAGFLAADKQKLTALFQAQADDEDTGAPKAANYESKSGAIVEILEDMKDKAETQLDALRMTFTKTKQEFKMMEQSLNAALDADNKDLTENKNGKASAEEGKATSEEELSATIKLLGDSTMGLATTRSDCMQTAADHDASVKSRAEELKVIATARKIVKEATSLAQESDVSEEPESFLQVSESSKLKTHARVAGQKIVMVVKKLASEHHSKSLAQLASHISAIMEFGSGSGDPFAKVKSMLTDMIAKLEKENEEAAAEKAYCDEQMSKTEAKKGDLEDDLEKLKVKTDEATSASAGLKEDVNVLGKELAALAKEQGQLDKVRGDSNKVFLEAQAELQKGLKGIRKALDVLKEYYGGAAASAAMLQEGMGDFMKQPKMPASHGKSGGAGGSIISILEVCEADMAKELAAIEKMEADEVAEYESVSQQNEVTKTKKEQDAKYKTQEYKTLDNNLAEMAEDMKSTQTELDTVLDYYEKVKQRCVAKPEPYEERVKRRNAEIAGLREALSILDSEAALMQSGKKGSRNRQHFLGQ